MQTTQSGMSDYSTNSLEQALQRLDSSPFPSDALPYLQAHADTINLELQRLVLTEIPAYTQSTHPETLAALRDHGPLHAIEILRLLHGGGVGDFEFVIEHAKRRAEQGFPLEITLHAYRCGHKVFSYWLRKAGLINKLNAADMQEITAAVADFSIEYTDTISRHFTSAYLAHTQFLADVLGDKRAQLLNILLEGFDKADDRVANIVQDAGYLADRQVFCVALVQSANSSEMLQPEHARQLADSINKLFSHSAIKRLIDLRENKVTVVFSAMRRQSGWTPASSTLARKICSTMQLMDQTVLVGVSNDVLSSEQIPKAYKEAQHAFEQTGKTQHMVCYGEIPTVQMLIHLAGEEFRQMSPAWLTDLGVADAKARGTLACTLHAYADNNMNTLLAAKKLAVHPNTIYARFHKIQELSGHDPKTYHGLTELLLILQGQGKPN